MQKGLRMEKKKAKKFEDKIDDLKSKIVANSKDMVWAKDMLTQLTSLQKQADIEAVELIVPVKEVSQTIDFDSYTFKKTPRGILFTLKGGLYTFVESRMRSVYEMLDNVFYMHENHVDGEVDKQIYDAYVSATATVMQAALFSSFDEKTLYETAAGIFERFNALAEENVDNAELHEETEEDIKANIAFENAGKAIEEISNIQMPDIESAQE